jgi:ribosomal protein S12 methylthiotransferase accessory factor
MEMIINFPGGARVEAQVADHLIKTDQPAPAGEGSAPTPFAVFLSSIGTCAGIYVVGFCQSRGIPTDNIRIVQRMSQNPATHMVDKITLEIQVPPEFPEKYYPALVRSANQCAVKKHLENPPKFDVYTKPVQA